MIIIGVTGRMGSGKSTVAGMLRDLGCHVADADAIVRDGMKRNEKLYRLIVNEFGNEFLLEDGELDKSRFGDYIFADETERKRFERIIHKEVTEEIYRQMEYAKQNGYTVFVIDAPLLIEADMHKTCDSVWVVVSDMESDDTAVERVMNRSVHLTKEQIIKRLEAQKPISVLMGFADVIIYNNDSISCLRENVYKNYNKITASYLLP
jgi:dephospho-CoA kinase